MPDRPSVLTEFVSLTKRKRELQAKLNDIKSELAMCEQRAIETIAMAGCKRITTEDNYTVSRTPKVSVTIKKGRHADAVQAAKKIGLDDIVTLQTTSLAAAVRRMMDAGEEIDDELKECLNIYEYETLSVKNNN